LANPRNLNSLTSELSLETVPLLPVGQDGTLPESVRSAETLAFIINIVMPSRSGFVVSWALNYPRMYCIIAEILKENLQVLGSIPSPGLHPLFFWWDGMTGLGKPQLLAKFEVAGFIYCGNIREFVLVIARVSSAN